MSEVRNRVQLIRALKAKGWTRQGGLWKNPRNKRQHAMTGREAAGVEGISGPPHCFE